ncbi:hypothetical protein RchiOBHm_Chr4g0396101 [Rosa chinensis]|uniref:Uncharacterized protein n=1 Tax=Rosa chinensis TaxID=74649 RepID=A0A2P6QRR9_ROSCH|nr:hypothetical protein RchiOBHm_Chr4g0396101 [Rosa chinensis]
MESGVLVLTHPHPWRPRYSLHSLFQNPRPPSSHLLRSYTTKYRRWDSNAETIRSKTFGFSFRDRRNGDEDEEEDDDDYEEEDDYGYNTSKGKKKKNKRRWWSDGPSEMEEKPVGVLEEAIDSVWIFKVIIFTSPLLVSTNLGFGIVAISWLFAQLGMCLKILVGFCYFFKCDLHIATVK